MSSNDEAIFRTSAYMYVYTTLQREHSFILFIIRFALNYSMQVAKIVR